MENFPIWGLVGMVVLYFEKGFSVKVFLVLKPRSSENIECLTINLKKVTVVDIFWLLALVLGTKMMENVSPVWMVALVVGEVVTRGEIVRWFLLRGEIVVKTNLVVWVWVILIKTNSKHFILDKIMRVFQILWPVCWKPLIFMWIIYLIKDLCYQFYSLCVHEIRYGSWSPF